MNNSLNPFHTRAFLKKVRYEYGPLRYYLIGEYGSSLHTHRPHYHALLFGQNLSRPQLEELWQKGQCDSGSVTHESAQYVAGYINYTTKKEDLGERYPEFSRMSRNPGIGFKCVAHLVTYHETAHGSKQLLDNRDVQGSVRTGKKIRPLGRYIVRKTREALGVPHSDPMRPNFLDGLGSEARYLREDLREVTRLRSSAPPIRTKL